MKLNEMNKISIFLRGERWLTRERKVVGRATVFVKFGMRIILVRRAVAILRVGGEAVISPETVVAVAASTSAMRPATAVVVVAIVIVVVVIVVVVLVVVVFFFLFLLILLI